MELKQLLYRSDDPERLCSLRSNTPMFEQDNLVKRVVTLCSLWSNTPMFEQEAPKWHTYKCGVEPIKRVPTAMFSLVNTPMLEQEAPKWPHINFWPWADQEGADSYAQWAGSPQVITWTLALRRSRGYRQLCSMSRKPPNDHQGPMFELCCASNSLWSLKLWASSLLNDDKDSALKKWNDKGPKSSGMPTLLYCL